MKIKMWGHASFLLTAEDGTKILTDPYNEELPYQQITDVADIVTVSHGHFDHNAVNRLSGSPEVVSSLEGLEKEHVKIWGIHSYHDQEQGSKRGENIIFLIEIEGKKICHLGDLGHPLTDEQMLKLEGLDILLVPVGGFYTIDARQAYGIVEQLNPTVVIPMHFKTGILDFPITGVNDFTGLFAAEQVKFTGSAEIEVSQLTDKDSCITPMVYVLDYVK